MGYMRHHAIVVTSWNQDHVAKAHAKAVEMFGELVTNTVQYEVNGGASFLIGPDGSKEGWEHSDRRDATRDEYKRWLRSSSTYVQWSELIVGDDDDRSVIVDHGGWFDTIEGLLEQ